MVTMEESIPVSKGLSTGSQIPESPTSATPSEREQSKESLEKETPKQCGCRNKTVRRELTDIEVIGTVILFIRVLMWEKAWIDGILANNFGPHLFTTNVHCVLDIVGLSSLFWTLDMNIAVIWGRICAPLFVCWWFFVHLPFVIRSTVVRDVEFFKIMESLGLAPIKIR
ncbi:hypothetical protein TWF569_006668 [Orbilia oligospora]|nr:hypothetical protein TWF706_011435 [Orbilia oligospora]KAF3140044.1 hypothetical protein TWF594_006439 [Orbilia oligospora]KAF3145038.1 hypothetical protein TWF569_006668 [Orbilia oligospora]